MAADNAIREFLVKLGFRVDQPALKSFKEGVGAATKAVVKLAGAIEGTATIVAAGVARFASNLEDLYFAAQRTGSSATQLMAFQRTAQNFGASAEEARGSVEGLAHALRSNPGNVSLLESLIGHHLTRTKNGAYDATEALMQFGNAMRSRGYFQPGHFYMAEQYGQMFGISERTLLALRNGSFGREFARIEREMRGNGFDKAARDAHRFMVSLRDLETQLQVFGAQVIDALQNKLGVNLKQLDAWLQKNGPHLASQLVAGAMRLYHAADWIGQKIAWVIRLLAKWDQESHGWSTRVLAMLVLLRQVGGFDIIRGVLGLTAAFLRLGGAIQKASTAGGALGAAGWMGKLGIASLVGYGAYKGGRWASDWAGHKLGLGTDVGSALGGWIYKVTHRGQQAMMTLMSQGWTHAQAAGILANLQAESGLKAGAIGDEDAQGRYRAYGLAQWHKPFWDLYKQWSGGKDIHDASFSKQLAFLNWDFDHGPDRLIGNLMHAATNAGSVARIMSLRYERPAAGMAAANARAAAAVQISQKTDIHVHGQSDALGAAHEVSREQRHVNADLARNLTSGVR